MLSSPIEGGAGASAPGPVMPSDAGESLHPATPTDRNQEQDALHGSPGRFCRAFCCWRRRRVRRSLRWWSVELRRRVRRGMNHRWRCVHDRRRRGNTCGGGIFATTGGGVRATMAAARGTPAPAGHLQSPGAAGCGRRLAAVRGTPAPAGHLQPPAAAACGRRPWRRSARGTPAPAGRFAIAGVRRGGDGGAPSPAGGMCSHLCGDCGATGDGARNWRRRRYGAVFVTSGGGVPTTAGEVGGA